MTRFCPFGGTGEIPVLTLSVRASSSQSPSPFPLARGRLGVRDSGVSRERALRHVEQADESQADPGAQLSGLRSRSAPTVEPADEVPLDFDGIFRRYAPYVGALVLKLLGRPADVDDVVQDVFMQAHRGLVKLRDPAAVRPWLRRITIRRTRRFLRKRWVLRWFSEASVESQTDLADPSASPEERAQIAHIYRRLELMARDERLAWVLRFVEGETLEGIAELLGCSVSTVQRRLRTAEASMGEVR